MAGKTSNFVLSQTKVNEKTDTFIFLKEKKCDMITDKKRWKGRIQL